MNFSDSTRELRVTLTDPEINTKARRSAKLSAEVRNLHEQKKTAASHYRAEIETRETEMDAISRVIENGWEDLPVNCRTLFDSPQTGWKTTLRLDTGEVVETEPMSAKELQRPLQFAVMPGPESSAPSEQLSELGGTDSPSEADPPALMANEAAVSEDATIGEEPAPPPLYLDGSTCALCDGLKTLGGGEMTCPDCARVPASKGSAKDQQC